MKHSIRGWRPYALAAAAALFLVACEQPEPPGSGQLVWRTDLPQALAEAKAGNKRVFVDFTGSDWCPACQKFSRRVGDSAVFEQYARTNLVLVKVDFPQHHPQPPALAAANLKLQQQYAPETAFPTLLLLDAEGRPLLKQVGYDGRSARDYTAALATAGAPAPAR